MAKTESTAVNELIELVQSNSSAPAEPSADLFAAPASAPASNRPHRMTSPVPALRGAGEVEPLPPRRAPHATSPQLPLSASPVRMSTADPERGNTIPPLSVPTSRPSPRTPPLPAPRASAAALPPPRKTPRSTASVPVRADRPDDRESAEVRAEREIAELRARRESSRMRAQRPSSPPPVPQRAATVPPPVPQRAATVPPPVPQRAASIPPPLPHQRASVQVPVVPAPRTAAQMPAVSAPNLVDELPPGTLPRPSSEMPPLSDDSPLPVHVASDDSPLPVHVASDDSPLPVSRSSSHASPLPVSRTSSHASPLPVSRTSSHASPLPIQQRATVPSLPSLPPPTAPVAAPFDRKPFTAVPQQYPVVSRPRTVDATGDVVRADQWFESTAAVAKIDHTEGTAIVNREYVGTVGLLKRLAVPAIVCAAIGALAGGYIAFYSQDDIQPMQTSASTSPPPSTRVEMAVSPTPEAAPGVAAAEPPTKAEQVAKAEEAAEAATGESMLPAATAAALAATADPTAAAAPTAATDSTPTAAPAAETAAAPSAVAAADSAPVAAADSAPANAVATSPSPAPIRQVQTTRGIVKLVDVRIDSKPSGATVMLVDDGKTSFLGSTPLATSLDPSRKYDVIFTLEGRPTQMAPLDPSKTSTLAVTLGRAKSSRSAKKSSRAAKTESFVDAIDKSAVEAKAEAKADEKPAKKAVEKPAKKAIEADAKAEKAVERTAEKKTERGGEGTLMVSSKPPCEILIDGKPTGLTTPQRSIPLPAGAHKITFINASAGINKTVSVTINADKPTKLIQNLMQ